MSKEKSLELIRTCLKNFNKIAKKLKAPNTMIIRGVHNYVYLDLKDSKARFILDIGCGDAYILSKLMRHQSKNGLKLFGIDKSERELKKAKRRVSKLPIRIKKGFSDKIPFKRKFDLIYSSSSYHEWNDKDSSIKHILKKLGKNGKFIIYDMHINDLSRFKRKYHGFTVKITNLKPLLKIEFIRI